MIPLHVRCSLLVRELNALREPLSYGARHAADRLAAELVIWEHDIAEGTLPPPPPRRPPCPACNATGTDTPCLYPTETARLLREHVKQLKSTVFNLERQTTDLLTRARDVCHETVMRGQYAPSNAANLENAIDSFLQANERAIPWHSKKTP